MCEIFIYRIQLLAKMILNVTLTLFSCFVGSYAWAEIEDFKALNMSVMLTLLMMMMFITSLNQCKQDWAWGLTICRYFKCFLRCVLDRKRQTIRSNFHLNVSLSFAEWWQTCSWLYLPTCLACRCSCWLCCITMLLSITPRSRSRVCQYDWRGQCSTFVWNGSALLFLCLPPLSSFVFNSMLHYWICSTVALWLKLWCTGVFCWCETQNSAKMWSNYI